MGTSYRESDIKEYRAAWVQSDIKTGVQQRTGDIYKLLITIEDEETGEIYFSIDQYWIHDDEKGVILNDKGERRLFDTENEALFYIHYGKTSAIDVIVNKMKTSGFNSLSDKEKEMLKEHNKRMKQKK